MTTSTIPPETVTERTRPFTDAEHEALRDALSVGQVTQGTRSGLPGIVISDHDGAELHFAARSNTPGMFRLSVGHGQNSAAIDLTGPALAELLTQVRRIVGAA